MFDVDFLYQTSSTSAISNHLENSFPESKMHLPNWGESGVLHDHQHFLEICVDECRFDLLCLSRNTTRFIGSASGDGICSSKKFAMKIDTENLNRPLFKVSDTHYAATWFYCIWFFQRQSTAELSKTSKFMKKNLLIIIARTKPPFFWFLKWSKGRRLKWSNKEKDF